jgi:chromosomal replication initiator protein
VIVCADSIVPTIESRIAEKIGPQKYNVWFRNATSLVITGNCLRIGVPNHFIGEFIERHFTEVIEEAAREAAGEPLSLAFITEPELARGLAKKQPDRQVDFMSAHVERRPRRLRGGDAPQPTLRGRIDDFVVGPSNQMAHMAAAGVIDQPAGQYNPLFVHGGCGVGKTHLLQAICNGIHETHPAMKVVYCTGEEFTNDFVCSVRARDPEPFRRRYRGAGVLVIDDVHFLANKRSTQEEFLHTFKAIDVLGCQVVLSSDAPPRMISSFSDHLVSRFLAGMVVRIDPPDVAVRTEVLRLRAQRLGVDVPRPIIDHIAERFRANIRELEGALLKVVAFSRVHNEPMTVSLAERAIRDLVRHIAPVVMLSDIESIVSIYFGLSPTDLHTSRKSRTIALARGIAMFLARKHTEMSFPEIGRFMGNKNHSTVILACRRIGRMLQAGQPVSWQTAAGPKQCDLVELVRTLEEQVSVDGGASRSGWKASGEGTAPRVAGRRVERSAPTAQASPPGGDHDHSPEDLTGGDAAVEELNRAPALR